MGPRRACTTIAADRSVVLYRSRRPEYAALCGRLLELADQRRHFGYRRLQPPWSDPTKSQFLRMARSAALALKPVEMDVGGMLPEA